MSIMIRCCATESILMSVTSCVQSCTQLSGLVWRVGSVQSLLMITKKLLRTRYCTAAMCECTVYTISCMCWEHGKSIICELAGRMQSLAGHAKLGCSLGSACRCSMPDNEY